jgi:hypothetical protein
MEHNCGFSVKRAATCPACLAAVEERRAARERREPKYRPLFVDDNGYAPLLKAYSDDGPAA